MFKKTRRVARKVGVDEDEDVNTPAAVVQRPSTKPKQSSALRTSFVPDNEPNDSSAELDSSLKATSKKTSRQIDLKDRLPFRAGEFQDRPSYNADYLAELKNSTPTTSRDAPLEPVSELDKSQNLEITAESGTDVAISHGAVPSLIPTDAEIREKKERRRRLAKEQDYISLNDNERSHSESDSEDEDPRKRSLILPAEELKPTEKYAETRLVHDDEDMAEGFEDFVEDAGQVTLGKQAAREQEQKRRKEMQSMIQNAQRASSDSESVDSEDEARNKAYEATQTRAGTYGSNRRGTASSKAELERRLEMAPRIMPIPDLNQAVAQFKQRTKAAAEAQDMRRQKLEELKRELEKNIQDQERLPVLIKEAAERYEKWRAEMRIDETPAHEALNGIEVPRGLENFGTMQALPET